MSADYDKIDGKTDNRICEDLALLKVFKAMMRYDLNRLTNGQLYQLYQDNYDPSEFKEIVDRALPEDL